MDTKVLQDHVDAINRIIESFLPQPDEQNQELAEAVCYSVQVGGKRLRPMFIQETWRMFAGAKDEPEILHAFMAAIEFIHTYSLVHDDLPAMDNDLLRRGQPTTHARYGEAPAILTGDALLNLAFEIIFRAIEGSEEPDDYMGGISAARILSEKAGMFGMIGGQYIDVYADQHPDFTVDAEKLSYIYRNKTSALLEASMMIGAVLGGASDLEIDLIEQIARNIGMAFQIQDDILDVTGDQAELGKPIGSDAKNHKQTWVSIYGMEASQKAVEEFTAKALQMLDHLRYRNPFLRELITELVHRKK